MRAHFLKGGIGDAHTGDMVRRATTARSRVFKAAKGAPHHHALEYRPDSKSVDVLSPLSTTSAINPSIAFYADAPRP